VTRDEIQAYVQDRLSIVTADTARITQIVNLTGYYYEKFCAVSRATIATATITFPLANQSITLPADVLSVEALRGTTGEQLKPVTPRELDRLAGLYSANAPSLPAYWAWWSRTVGRVWPAKTGSADTTASILYNQAPAALSAGSSVPSALPTFAQFYIAEAVCYHMARSEENWQEADRASQFLNGEIPMLVAWGAERAGDMLPHSGFDNDLSLVFPSSTQVRAGMATSPSVGGRR
jgi:hypothetical protein